MTNRIRVLVVDDSAFARKVLREILAADPRLEVVGYARDGLDALEKIAETHPDVLAMDLVMPELDGAGVLEAMRDFPDPPRVVIVTTTDMESPRGVVALQAGAFDVVHKPTALATDRLYELGAELVEKVVAAASARGRTRVFDAPVTVRVEKAEHTDIVVIGTSTGGPRALTIMLRALPASFPVPIAIVVHMPPGYTEAFAERLDKDSALEVMEAREGTALVPGRVVLAQAGRHLFVRNGICVLSATPPSLHVPSVDELFRSAAEAYGDRVLGVVLTGMGMDGLEGARALHARGARVIVEAKETCVVHGMPRSVAEAGLAQAEIALPNMADEILRRL